MWEGAPCNGEHGAVATASGTYAWGFDLVEVPLHTIPDSWPPLPGEISSSSHLRPTPAVLPARSIRAGCRVHVSCTKNVNTVADCVWLCCHGLAEKGRLMVLCASWDSPSQLRKRNAACTRREPPVGQ